MSRTQTRHLVREPLSDAHRTKLRRLVTLYSGKKLARLLRLGIDARAYELIGGEFVMPKTRQRIESDVDALFAQHPELARRTGT